MSEVTVRIPAPLRAFADGRAELGVPAGTVADVLQAACEHHPGLGARLFTPEGELRPFVNVFVGERHIGGLQGLDTQVESGEVLSIIPAVAGGGAATDRPAPGRRGAGTAPIDPRVIGQPPITPSKGCTST